MVTLRNPLTPRIVVVVFAALAVNIASANYAGLPCSGNQVVVDPTDCNIYYQCVHEVYWKMQCPATLNFNRNTGGCDWAVNAPCEDGGDAPAPTQGTPAPSTTTTTQSPDPTSGSGSSTPSPTTQAPPQTGSPLITFAEFRLAATTKHGSNPTEAHYLGFIASLPAAHITTRREAILFLAHAIWETVGFQYTKENLCQWDIQACIRAYPNQAGGLPGKVYYGRGPMQLTWDYNYRAASLYLYGDLRLIQNPEPVGEVPEIGWATAAWYWYANVHDRSSTFGSTLKAINGHLECEGGSHGGNRYLRFTDYRTILRHLGESEVPDSDGWCTSW